ncbi:MAG: AAA-like domain-containing protein [Pseudomonadota bacterium]
MSDKSNDKLDPEPTQGQRVGLDSTGEFFSVGAPLHAVRAGYVQRAADDALYEHIIAGRFAHVIAPDRSGKSSLIAATAARLENNGCKVAVLDLQQIGARDAGTDAGRWYYSVAYRLLRQLRIRVDLQTWWQDKSMLRNRQRLLEFYSEVILKNISERVVIFVDEIQSIGDLPFSDQLLASFRSAHNARATDPEFSRLTVVLLGECDPLSLIDEPEQSPFNVTQSISLGDFARDDLDLFIKELNLSPQQSAAALDRIYYWTEGQPYLSQKLSRAISRDAMNCDVGESVDRIAMQQLGGRSALHNEPHMSHIHREVVKHPKRKEGLLNLYGKIRKGSRVAADLGSTLQRRLIAIGLIAIDEDGDLKVRNRLYESVFTARWANENLPNHWRVPALVAAGALLILALPFWYTQVLPKGYAEVLNSDTVDLAAAEQAYRSLHSFPGHSEGAENLFLTFLNRRARAANSPQEIMAVAAVAKSLPPSQQYSRVPEQLTAQYWDRRAQLAQRNERRDTALLATLESLVLSTPQRRKQASALLGDDYPMLIASLPAIEGRRVVFNAGSMLITEIDGADMMQWSLGGQTLTQRENWTITALEVSPLLRRVIVDSPGTVQRAGLTLNLSHARVADLRVKVIAPSGRTIEIDPGVETASTNEDIRVPARQLRELIGEPLAGTWSLSVRDEELGVAGQLVGWNLQLNSQGLVEDFQRGLNIPDPVEGETDNLWFSADGRFAIARAMQSDSARIWDLAFAKPVRAIAVSEFESLIGLGLGARRLVTATQDSVKLWDTATGNRVADLDIGAASGASTLSDDGSHLFVQRRSDIDTQFELWSLADAKRVASLSIAGSPAQVALSGFGNRIAVADYDRAVRVWDLHSGEQVAQIDLAEQPSLIRLSADGKTLGAVFGTQGAALWNVGESRTPLYEDAGPGNWHLEFSGSGRRVMVGRAEYGFQVINFETGRRLGAPFGVDDPSDSLPLLGFSNDEQTLVTGGDGGVARFWRAPSESTAIQSDRDLGSARGPRPGDAFAVAPDATFVAVGDRSGNVHIVGTAASTAGITPAADTLSFLGHQRPVVRVAVSDDSLAVASVAEDNSVRVWDASTGEPRAFLVDLSGNPVQQVAFSPDGSRLGFLSSNRLHVLDAQDGALLARFELGERHQALAFAEAEHIYLGSEGGTLRVVHQADSGEWNIRSLWQGSNAIRTLRASPRAPYLIFVDQQNVARQFHLADGTQGRTELRLPSRVDDVQFTPSGSRVIFRTARWFHRATSTSTGLVWSDATFAPPGINAVPFVFGDSDAPDYSPLGSRLLLPVTEAGVVKLNEVSFDASDSEPLFGNRDDLLNEWRNRLGMAERVIPLDSGT